MKADQSSLYRQLEMLHLWCLETFENAPKQPMMQADIKLLAENIMQAQSAVALALNTADIKQRLDFLDVVLMSMTNVKSITKVLTEYSAHSDKGCRVISKQQRVRMLDIMTVVGNELGRWHSKTLATINSVKAANLPK